MVREVHVSPIPMQTNDISINLITSVNFLKKVCPKGHIAFQAPPPLTLWLGESMIGWTH
jgi:hypothetical protein